MMLLRPLIHRGPSGEPFGIPVDDLAAELDEKDVGRHPGKEQGHERNPYNCVHIDRGIAVAYTRLSVVRLGVGFPRLERSKTALKPR